MQKNNQDLPSWNDGLTIRNIFLKVRSNWLLFLIISILGGGMGAWINHLNTKIIYTADVLFQPGKINGVEVESTQNIIYYVNKDLLDDEESGLDTQIRDLAGISIRADIYRPGSNVVKITCNNESPELASKYANAVVEILIKNQLQKVEEYLRLNQEIY